MNFFAFSKLTRLNSDIVERLDTLYIGIECGK
jgi:hypothetical protein